MTYLLVCALCAGSGGEITLQGGADPGAPVLALDLAREAPPFDLERAAPVPLNLADHAPGDGRSGHDDGAHMGPMWIMMGVMMVGMMVALGAYMMRGQFATTLQPGALASPHLSAIPPAVGFRPGG